MKPLSSIHQCFSHLHLTRWRLIIVLWIGLIYAYFYHHSQHVIVTDPTTVLNLVHCHINSVLLRQPNSYAAPNVDLCCPNKTQLELRFSNVHLTPTFYHVFRSTPDVCFGSWQPVGCQSHQKVAVLIPYRDRELHLRLLLARLHQLLQHQRIQYRIYVIEQAGNAPFNRGLLLNIGIREALLRDPVVDCFIFHDVDLLPENSDNLYVCDKHLRHLAAGVDEFRYHVPFMNYAGGVSSLSKVNVLKTNGFPNRYWGWGNEDDELAARCYLHGLQLTRPRTFVGRYRAVRHLKATRGSGHYDSFRAFRSFLRDGLSALSSTTYRILEDSSPERLLHHAHQTKTVANVCNYSKLLTAFNITISDWLEKACAPEGWADRWDALARLLLYTHLVVDVDLMRYQTIQPASKSRESWYWFLHFYGWI
ncbi:UDP-Gal:betaGlcNAc beta 1 4-galactosyltransferase polypeptide 4 [Fasciola gigantica]|uniref:Beta-1,4-galactosyltransferase n=1 Tax=Fasciola gigantica TaxID=46835 RepID=A0A504X3Q4_FASGI|nr:UDP-Gal:betaGlcNAc beta 1 4-galactosyltransferase polypeptide 4 [Fasciola gigantica]